MQKPLLDEARFFLVPDTPAQHLANVLWCLFVQLLPEIAVSHRPPTAMTIGSSPRQVRAACATV
jgi:hypothetical protein